MLARSYVTGVNAKNTVGGVAPVPAITHDFTSISAIRKSRSRCNGPTFRHFSPAFRAEAGDGQRDRRCGSVQFVLPTGASGSMPPVAPTCTKPWLVANIDPGHPGNLQPCEARWLARETGSLDGTAKAASLPSRSPCRIFGNGRPSPLTTPGYLPAALPNPPGGTCPSCSGGGRNSRKVWLVATRRTPRSIAAARPLDSHR